MTAIAYYNTTLSRDLVQTTKVRFMNALAFELELNREAKQKATAYTADVNHIIKAIWKFDSFFSECSLDLL